MQDKMKINYKKMALLYNEDSFDWRSSIHICRGDRKG